MTDKRITEYRVTALPGACCRCGRYPRRVGDGTAWSFDVEGVDRYGTTFRKAYVVCGECKAKEEESR